MIHFPLYFILRTLTAWYHISYIRYYHFLKGGVHCYWWVCLPRDPSVLSRPEGSQLLSLASKTPWWWWEEVSWWSWWWWIVGGGRLHLLLRTCSSCDIGIQRFQYLKRNNHVQNSRPFNVARFIKWFFSRIRLGCDFGKFELGSWAPHCDTLDDVVVSLEVTTCSIF